MMNAVGLFGSAITVSPEVQNCFYAVDTDRSGRITAKELQTALSNGLHSKFSDTACTLMIGMFDKDFSGAIDIYEFQQLYTYINQWFGVFQAIDRDRSGSVDEQELAQAFRQMNYNFKPDFTRYLVAKSSPQTRRVSFDQFIVICVQVQKLTDAIKLRDPGTTGMVTIGTEDLLILAISCSA